MFEDDEEELLLLVSLVFMETLGVLVRLDDLPVEVFCVTEAFTLIVFFLLLFNFILLKVTTNSSSFFVILLVEAVCLLFTSKIHFLKV